jgi:hypothetical protein
VTRALAAAAGLALALPASAQATDYGGGTAPDSVARADRQLTLVGFRMADDGSGRVIVKVAAGCGVAKATRDVGLAADGTFALETTQRDGRQRPEITLSGRIVGLVAGGTVRARVTFRRGGRVVERCDSGTREWSARAPGAASAAPGGAYYGLTSQTARPFPFVLSVAGSRVRVAAFDYRMRCDRGGFEWENITPGGRIAQGTFSLYEQFSRRWREGRERFRVRLEGEITASGASGTLSVSSVLRAPGGRVLDRCSTGRQTFAAVP